MKQSIKIALAFVLATLICCKKSNDAIAGSGARNTSGTIYFNFANEGVYKMNAQTGQRTVVLPNNVSRYYWDVSPDGKMILETWDANDPSNRNYDLYKITDANSGAVISTFKWFCGYGNSTRPVFSPDGSMIAITAPYNGKIFVVDTRGNILHSIFARSGSFTGNLQWMPDNTLLFTINKVLYRSNTNFSDFPEIASFSNFSQFGQLAANKAGTKLVFMGAGNGDDNAHLWMMNINGSGLKQITQDGETEGVPAFSPDGNFLVFGSDLIQSIGIPWSIGGVAQGIAAGSSVWGVSIMPADGNTYNVETSKAVYHFPKRGSRNDRMPAGTDPMEWR